jgi:hypothetical protein
VNGSAEPLVEWRPPKSDGPLSARQFFVRAAIVVVVVAGVVLGVRSALRPFGVVEDSWAPVVRLEIVGDTSHGNLVVAGDRVYLMTREDLVHDGYEGALFIRHSDDGGETWSDRSPVAAHHLVVADSHALARAPDGSLWAIWVEYQENTATERFHVRRSQDGGATWSFTDFETIEHRSNLGAPVLSMTTDLRALMFTDGDSGRIVFQALGPAGEPSARNVTAGRTTRVSYAGIFDGAP